MFKKYLGILVCFVAMVGACGPDEGYWEDWLIEDNLERAELNEETSTFTLYEFSFKGRLYRFPELSSQQAEVLPSQEAEVKGSFLLEDQVNMAGMRSITDIDFSIQLGKGTLAEYQPITLSAQSDGWGYSQDQFGSGEGTSHLTLESEVPDGFGDEVQPSVAKSLAHGRSTLQLWISCDRMAPERFAMDPLFDNCQLGDATPGFYLGSVSVWPDFQVISVEPDRKVTLKRVVSEIPSKERATGG